MSARADLCEAPATKPTSVRDMTRCGDVGRDGLR